MFTYTQHRLTIMLIFTHTLHGFFEVECNGTFFCE